MANKVSIGAVISYCMFKSGPEEYSIDDLVAKKKPLACWHGIRNYQARNNLREKIKQGRLSIALVTAAQ